MILPLRLQDRPLGRLLVFADDHHAFSEIEDVRVMVEMAGDLTYGLDTLQAREQHLKARHALEHSLERTIEAIATTLEFRDPYTAGHQKRATRIAEAIAHEIGLDEHRLKGLFVAGTIHDIGKISVPVEILSRPGKLSVAEFEIIKGHAIAGYDIVKGIDFPWPVPQIIRQHHERLDGSGYPDGLSGNDILLEARILAVADVVEAISSHRPYRPALGLSAAVEEIRTHRGTRFDARVVDACLKLIDAGRLPLAEY
ncbi:phosphodiesterase [Thioalkalivibrio paradoxus ARh 1]|uniref:Phosphodiesterase n=1 Tax=Thioalkalivibrio paradoxus ARh 1 TaxID=713585 RepID=W0DJA7_9GAMM|nr:phosphodiesterase [Thioalkalivibrio paradoxus ARh 1]